MRKYELDLARGVMKADGPADHALMMGHQRLQGPAWHFTPLQEAMNAGRQASTPPRIVAKSMLFSEGTAAYLLEKKQDNAPQTLVEKGRTYKDFKDLFGNLDLNLYTKAEIVQWKTADIKRGLGGQSHLKLELTRFHGRFRGS